jgi:hypothetical protein
VLTMRDPAVMPCAWSSAGTPTMRERSRSTFWRRTNVPAAPSRHPTYDAGALQCRQRLADRGAAYAKCQRELALGSQSRARTQLASADLVEQPAAYVLRRWAYLERDSDTTA